MSKRFSEEFTAWVGAMPLTTRLMLENAATGAEYYATLQQLFAAIQVAQSPELAALDQKIETYDRTLTVASLADLDRVDLAGGMYNVSGGSFGRLIVTPTIDNGIVTSVLQQYFSSSGIRFRRIAISAPQTYPAWTWDNDYQRNVVGKILSDTTYSNPWIGEGIIELAEQGDSMFYFSNHGLIVGDVIEFDSGSGTLPDGIISYNASPSGMYYNVSEVISADSFRITQTIGGNGFAVNSYGDSGFRIRKTMQGVSVQLPSFENYNNVKIKLVIQYGFRQNQQSKLLMGINGDSNNINFGTTIRSWILPDEMNFAKLTTCIARIDLSKVDVNEYEASLSFNKISTSDGNNYVNETKTREIFIYTNGDATTLYIGSYNAIIMQIRSIRAIIYQQ